MKNHRIMLIGIDASGLTPEKASCIAGCTNIFCSSRFLDILQPIIDASSEVRVFDLSPLAESLKRMESLPTTSRVAILAGGDPLFFGIGKTLCQRFGKESVRIIPAVSSMQTAFSRFNISWDDACLLSVHGRGLDDLVPRINHQKKVFLFTDSTNSPATVASCLLTSLSKKQIAAMTMYVAENLDTKDERLTVGNPQEIADLKFADLSVMIIIQNASFLHTGFGLQENEIDHSRGLITKNEVRAATIHALCLPETGVFWDVGAGSGSISIEAASISPRLRIFAVESKKEQMANIMANSEKFDICTLRPVHGRAPEILASLPDPDRVFIGGSGGNLVDIVKHSAQRLKPNGIIVVNGVLEDTCRQAPEILYRLGFSVSISTLKVNRLIYPEKNSIEFNPISIIKAWNDRAQNDR